MGDSGKRATLKDVAARSGLSVSTVSRYINASGYVDKQSAGRIKQAVEELDYRPNKYARSLKTDVTGQIMLIIPDIMNPYYANIFREMQRQAVGDDYLTILYDTCQDYEGELRAFEYAKELDVDGVVYCSIYKAQESMERLLAVGKPAVVNNLYDVTCFDTLYSEAGKGVYTAAKHLLECGHTKIGYVGGPPSSDVNLRRKRGFLRAMEESGLPTPRDWLFEMDFTLNAGYKAGAYFAALPGRPTAICAANDVLALGVITAFHERGIYVPENVSITGEDNIEFAKTYRPALTTIENSSSYFARKSYELLMDRLGGAYRGEPRRVVCPRELIVRESTRRLHDKGEDDNG